MALGDWKGLKVIVCGVEELPLEKADIFFALLDRSFSEERRMRNMRGVLMLELGRFRPNAAGGFH